MLDSVSSSLKTYLDLLTVRQKLVASNLANIDTPGYRTRDLDFQGELNAAIGRSGSEDMSVGQTVAEVEGLPVNNDGNNVNLDREAKLLADNAMRFELASTLLSGRFRNLRLAIKEGNS